MKHYGHTLVLSLFLTGAALGATPAPVAAAQTANASDADITARVKTQIDGNNDFKGSTIEVATASGVVTLTGVVPSVLVRAKVGELTKATAGVTKVVNKITLAKK